ncbi:hypothetical protein [Sandaracinus amylolyticus]|uniref:Uncharacterized protein n=1 Tax=Sandaracinus amylolyticus TaxID=927083 RepID=A0A0F6YJU6_9BACT|nr:hypothetical protein [Sandaracinus amylolyticus]AKF07432.1 hypothetical protein DB32_004581 [Sandaracinus amylolyticus]
MSAGKPIYEASFVSAGARNVVAILGALALTGAVGAGVVLIRGSAEAVPELLVGSIVLLVVFGIAAAVAQLGASRRVIVVRDERVRLRVERAGGVELALEGPFELDAAWYEGEIATGRSTMSHPVLLLVLRERGRPVLLLEESLGTLHRPPADWPRGYVNAAGARKLVNSIGRVHLDRLRELLAPAA